MDFVTRDQWGAEAPKGTYSIGSTLGVSLHWEGPRMGNFPHSACAGKVRGIQRYHMHTKGWSDIAYNAVVCPHGSVFEGRGAWRKSAANGWEQVNLDWYAVCYLGGVGDPFTDEGKAGMIDAVRWLRAHGGAGPRVNGHRDHKATQCPGDTIHAWLKTTNFDQPTEDEMSQYEDQLNAIQREVKRQGDLLDRLMYRSQQAGKTQTRRYRDLRDRADADAERDGKVTLTLDELRELIAGGTDENGEGKERRVP